MSVYFQHRHPINNFTRLSFSNIFVTSFIHLSYISNGVSRFLYVKLIWDLITKLWVISSMTFGFPIKFLAAFSSHISMRLYSYALWIPLTIGHCTNNNVQNLPPFCSTRRKMMWIVHCSPNNEPNAFFSATTLHVHMNW